MLGFDYLAQEEAKTLLDDIYEGRTENFLKSDQQIKRVLEFAVYVDRITKKDITAAMNEALEFLIDLEKNENIMASGDKSIDLSRGDYKICEKVLLEELSSTNFKIIDKKEIGPVQTIGGMVVYVLKKRE